MEQLLTLAAEYDMLPPGETVLCALSGGADSVCLAHFLRCHAEKGGYKLVCAHYNHHIRGEEANADARFVSDFCKTHSIPLLSGEGDVLAQGGNLEEAARQMRYAFLADAQKQCGAARIATAHNADDNLESLLLNLARGCGLQGLTGIPPRRGAIVRPLLTTSRAEIISYLTANALPHVEDATNGDDTYARNRIRHQVVPVLQTLNPHVMDAATATISFLRQDNDFIMAQSAKLCAAAAIAEGDVVFPARTLACAPAAVAARCVPLLVGKLDGRFLCSSKHVAAVLSLASGHDPSAQVSLAHGVTVFRDYEFIRFSLARRPLPFQPVPLHWGENPIAGTDFCIILDTPVSNLLARPRQKGDSVTLPKVGTKTIQDWMVDKKIPLRLRDTLPVVADDHGVLALCGFGMNPGHPLAKDATLTFLRKENPGDQVTDEEPQR